MNNIAIIPARSGSKGLKDKNIKELNGKPLIAYSIEEAIKSEQFETIMVSTDSKQYAEIAKGFGAEVPFLRSEKASTDTASSWDVVSEVISKYKEIGKLFDTFMLLQPTSPLRTAEDIKRAYVELEKHNANAIVSVCEVEHSPLLAGTLPDDLSLQNFISRNNLKRRQDMQTYYRFNGAIYLAYVGYFEQGQDIYRDKSFAYIMEKKNSVDIDDEYDFAIATAVLMQKGKAR